MEFGYLGLAKPLETTYSDGRNIIVYPNGKIIPQQGIQNENNPQQTDQLKTIIIPLALMIGFAILTKGVDYFVNKR